jgi:G protein-coupled receptor GPR1
MNNYAALALVSSSSSSSSTNNNNNNNQRGSSLLTANNNGLNLASGHITPPNSGLLNLNINNNNNNNNNNQNNSINLPQNLLNQLNAANLISNSAPSPNRQLVYTNF